MLETPGAYPRRKYLKGAPIGLALALLSNSKAQLERVSKGKCSSLLGLIVSNKGKEFYNIDTSLDHSCSSFGDDLNVSVKQTSFNELVSISPNPFFFVADGEAK